MRLFKSLFGGLFSFFGILFGGLIDLVTGGNSKSDQSRATSTQEASEVTSAASVEPAPPTAAPETQVTTSAPESKVPISTMPLRSKPAVAVTTPFDVQAIDPPRPTRRPGKAMTMFKAMARDLPRR